MHAEVELPVAVKTGIGKGTSRKIRVTGQIPAIIYGFGTSPKMITLEERALVKALSTPAGRNVFLRLKCDDAEINGIRTLVKDLQVHPLKRRFMHADLYKIDPDREIHATVAIKLTGTAIGTKLGGILQITQHDISVTCKPDDLPEAIVVDVTNLKLGHSIHIYDIVPPAGVKITMNPKLAICAVISPSSEEEGKGGEAEESK